MMPFSGPLDNQCPEFSKPTGDGNNVSRMGSNRLAAQLQVCGYFVHSDGKAQTIDRNESQLSHRGIVSRQQANAKTPRTITAK